jgi:Tn3 transposase DDE domain-containing protein
MNKASCLSLVSNTILYWNTLKITDIVEQLRAQGEEVTPETLAHISLVPFRPVVPNGTYCIEEREPDCASRARGDRLSLTKP